MITFWEQHPLVGNASAVDVVALCRYAAVGILLDEVAIAMVVDIRAFKARAVLVLLDGDKEGQGSLYWSNGDSYTGLWKNDKQNGKGVLRKKNGDVFDGNFRNGLLDGEVTIRFANGNRFRGTYKNGKRNGKAIEENKDRTRFEGSYVDDHRDGDFVEKDANGRVTAKGHYIHGRRIAD